MVASKRICFDTSSYRTLTIKRYSLLYPTPTSKPISMIPILKCSLLHGSLHLDPWFRDWVPRPHNPVLEKSPQKQFTQKLYFSLSGEKLFIITGFKVLNKTYFFTIIFVVALFAKTGQAVCWMLFSVSLWTDCHYSYVNIFVKMR